MHREWHTHACLVRGGLAKGGLVRGGHYEERSSCAHTRMYAFETVHTLGLHMHCESPCGATSCMGAGHLPPCGTLRTCVRLYSIRVASPHHCSCRSCIAAKHCLLLSSYLCTRWGYSCCCPCCRSLLRRCCCQLDRGLLLVLDTGVATRISKGGIRGGCVSVGRVDAAACICGDDHIDVVGSIAESHGMSGCPCVVLE